MLPPGHIAAGYLTAKAVLKFVPYHFSATQQHWLLLWGMFFALAPDLDTFYTFWKLKSFTKADPGENHRMYLSHVPILWLIPGVLIYALASNPFYKALGLMLWLGSWSHFFLDTIQYGIMWLWPLNTKLFSFVPIKGLAEFDQHLASLEGSFFTYWTKWIFVYSKYLKVAVMLEIIIIISALTTALR